MRYADLGLGILCLWICTAMAQDSVKIIDEKSWPGRLLVQTWTLPPSSFSEASLRQLFQTAILRDDGKHRMMKFDVFLDADAELRRHYFGTEKHYSDWRPLFDDYRGRIPPSAQLIFLNGNASMRVRELSGAVRRQVLSGSDPASLVIDGSRFHLADFSPRTLSFSREVKPELDVMFYYWSEDAYNQATVLGLLKASMAAVSIRQARVIVSPWPWFVEDLFPIVYPYWQIGEPPTESEYYQAPRIGCATSVGSEPTCWGNQQAR